MMRLVKAREASDIKASVRSRLCRPRSRACWFPIVNPQLALWATDMPPATPARDVYTAITAHNSRTASALLCNAAVSSAVSFTSTTCSTPDDPSLHGTPTYNPLTPYSPSRYAAAGKIFFLSLRIASTISTTADDGAYHALVPRY